MSSLKTCSNNHIYMQPLRQWLSAPIPNPSHHIFYLQGNTHIYRVSLGHACPPYILFNIFIFVPSIFPNSSTYLSDIHNFVGILILLLQDNYKSRSSNTRASLIYRTLLYSRYANQRHAMEILDWRTGI